ncbi:class I SAM-dependent methyltransferase [Natronorubrum sulfidifaciens]|uniref:Methyltransferase type 11 n=1 Tax=Natronorubrum sulfidifaciens JCM 14089 TaxID=1230460 RepID=L9WDH1_9EURY|nr:class I SAM-dependent methyltransferase [Natronorubrum sulfidifaciens]ELY47407.1 methyltransferase type 11 [Natronorubrum sulfidifaciens JCM 14089]
MSDSNTTQSPISHPLFATLYDWFPQSTLFAPHRTTLVQDLSGRVLELGCGTGDLFPFVAETDPEPLAYHAIEPDPHMRKRAARTASELSLEVDLRDARAESLPYPDDSFDIVLASVVFCTIQDPDTAVEEVARVLKPGGEFRFFEHVHADGWRGTGQRLLNPLWERVAGGCQLTRETIPRFVGHDAFSVAEIERLEFGVFPATPFVRGTVCRRRDGLLE